MAKKSTYINPNKIWDNCGDPVRIIKDHRTINGIHYVDIQFINPNMYGFYTIREMIGFNMILRNNKISDWYKPTVYGVGCKGNKITVYLSESGRYENLHEYDIWKNMLSRSYNPNDDKYKNYGAVMINPVCYRWLCYEYFCNDIVYLPGYDLWKLDTHSYQFDKDTLQRNVELKYKTYSPQTCCFITSRENTLEKHYRAALNQTGYIGVFLHKSNNYFVRIDGDYFGTYSNPIAAASMYNKIARYRGYPEIYINNLEYEMSIHEINMYIVKPHRKHGKYQMYKLIE